MLRAVIFDFNGIIVDDEPIHFELFKRVLSEEGIALGEEEYYEHYLGFDDRGAFIHAYREQNRPCDEQEIARLIDRKAFYYQEAIKSKTRVFPGVKRLVALLSRRFPLAIASGALKQEIETILSATDLRSYFRAIVSAEDVKAGKPEPEIYLTALARLNDLSENRSAIQAAECLVIEDSREGIRGAKSAGMKCLAVTNSYPAELLGEADCVVSSLEEVQILLLEKLCS
jgi:HAD superfamily hydrolase (TIGR01509 family)